MSTKSASLEEAWEALAEAEGMTVEELQASLLRDRMRSHLGARQHETPALPPAPTRALAGHSHPLPARFRQEPPEVEFPGNAVGPVRPGRRDDYESAAEAEDRWLREEAALEDGVHGFGGQTAGGIFGDAPIATSVYDPQAMQRSEGRAVLRLQGQQAQAIAQLTSAVGELMSRLGPARRGAAALPAAQAPSHRRLGRGKR
jgi:hypothetical protein